MQDSFGDSRSDQSTLQLIVDQLEELVVTIIEEIRERPAVAAAILAAVLGAVMGGLLAARLGRRASPPAHVVKRGVKRARGVAEAADVAGMALKLLQNPLVRGYIRSAVQGQLKKRFSL